MAGLHVDSQGRAAVRDPETGKRYWVPAEQAQRAVDQGFLPESSEEVAEDRAAQVYDAPGAAAYYGLLRGGTAGASDVLLGSALGASKELRGLEEHNPIASGVGEVAGAGASVLAGPAGLAGRAAARAVGGTAAKALLRAGAEGAVMGGGSGVSEVALSPEQEDLGEATGTIAKRAIAGATIGSVLSGVGLGLGSLARKAGRAAKAAEASEMGAQAQLRKKVAEDLAEVEQVADPAFQQARQAAEAAREQVESFRQAGVRISRKDGERVQRMLARRANLQEDMQALEQASHEELGVLLAEAKEVGEEAASTAAQRKAAAKAWRAQRKDAATPEQLTHLQLWARDPRLSQKTRDGIDKLLAKGPSKRQARQLTTILEKEQTGWHLPPQGGEPKGLVKEVRRLRRFATDPRLDSGLQMQLKHAVDESRSLTKLRAQELIDKAERSLGKPEILQREIAASEQLLAEARAAKGATGAPAKDAGERLAALQREIDERLAGWQPKSGVRPERVRAELETLEADLSTLQKQGVNLEAVQAARAYQSASQALEESAARAGVQLTGMRSGLPLLDLRQAGARLGQAAAQTQRSAFALGPGLLGGAAAGIVTDSLLGGGVGALIGARLVPKLAKALGKAATSPRLAKLVGVTGKYSLRNAAVDQLSRLELDEMRRDVGALDPDATRQAAMDAYLESGADMRTATLLSEFQGRRLGVLQQALQSPESPGVISQIVDAVVRPGAIVERIEADEMRPQDARVLRSISPSLYRQMAVAAREALEEDEQAKELSARRRDTLRRLIDDPSYWRLVSRVQAKHAESRAKADQETRMAQGNVPQPQAQRALERIDAAGGPGRK